MESKADEIRQQLPAGYELKPYYNQSAFVGDSIHSVLKTIYEGLFLAIIVMVLFLRSWRSSLVVMLTIPLRWLSASCSVIWQESPSMSCRSVRWPLRWD